MAVIFFKEKLRELLISDIEIIETQESTRTAQEAADTHNVPVSNIVKSLLVRIENRFELHLVPGDKRLDIEGIKKKNMTENVSMANADEVKMITGYSIGGVPPFGHKQRIETVIEDGFDKLINLVAAAGSSNSVFKISYERLEQLVSLK